MDTPQSIIGPNAAIRYLKDFKSHVDYWHEIGAAYHVGYIDHPDHIPYLLEYAAAMPKGTNVVARIWHPLDGGFHLAPTGKNPDGTPDTRRYVSSPSEYLAAYGHLGVMDNILLNVMNEPNANGTPDEMMRLVNWFIDFIPLAAAIRCKCVLFNWADRNPRIIDGMMDGQFDNVLRLMSAHPEFFFMGMHFYGPDEINSHLDSYVARCEYLKIKPPVVIGTEFGIDSTGGVETGYKSRPNYKDVYGGWLLTQVKPPPGPSIQNLYKHIQSGVLSGLCIFQEGNSGGQDAFDFETDKAVKDTLKRAVLAGEIKPPSKPEPPPPPPPPYTPPPFTKGDRYQITTPGEYINIRTAASPIAEKVGEVPNKSIVTVLDEALVDGEFWRRIAFGNFIGWVNMQRGAVQFAPYFPSMVNVPLDLLKDIANSLKSQANKLLLDYEMVKAILDQFGGEQ